MEMNPFAVWLIIAIAFVITEILSGTFYILCLAIGAFVIALFEAFIGSTWNGYFGSSVFLIETIIFAVTSAMFMTFLPRTLIQYKTNTAFEATIGEEVEIFEQSKILMVKIEGQKWRITNEGDFKKGQKAKVTAFEGTKVRLEKI